MKTRISWYARMVVLAVAALVLLWAAPPAKAGGLKERMAARLPVIDDLKARGIVGENNRGYLEFVGSPQKTAVVAAENADRREVYTAIARRAGSSPEVAGRQRAAQIARKSRPGIRLQRPDGAWYTK